MQRHKQEARRLFGHLHSLAITREEVERLNVLLQTDGRWTSAYCDAPGEAHVVETSSESSWPYTEFALFEDESDFTYDEPLQPLQALPWHNVVYIYLFSGNAALWSVSRCFGRLD